MPAAPMAERTWSTRQMCQECGATADKDLVLAIAVLAGLALHGGPVAHAAAVCSDYPNQAAAQKAKNTRDGDGDGIYCEDLPCPCLKPGAAGGGSAPPVVD